MYNTRKTKNFSMKTINQYFHSVLLLSFFLSSCTPEDPAPSPTDPRANYIGTWGVSENWHKLSYEVYISYDQGSSTGVYIDNFANAGTGVKAHASVSGSSISITDVPQNLSNGWVIENGSGSLQGTTKIIWNYVFNDGANQYVADATYSKKK
jgi:hypothetical protein